LRWILKTIRKILGEIFAPYVHCCALLSKTTETKNERIDYLRTTKQRKRLISHAAKIKHQNLSDFVLESATVRAEQTLAERTRFDLSPKNWEEFLQIIDRPVKENPGLKKLMENRTRFEDEGTISCALECFGFHDDFDRRSRNLNKQFNSTYRLGSADRKMFDHLD
jgi:uncharacterized protein (DUF1778 family)